MNPPLRWAGSKRQLLSKLRPYWRSQNRSYVEPFAGSACLFFELEPHTAILGDLNSELIDTYRVLQIDPHQVIACLDRLGLGPDNYYRIRAKDPGSLSLAERAARFLYLNFYCFNGLFRTNRAGDFNVPYAKSKGRKEIDRTLLLRAADQLKACVLISGDFEKTLGLVGRGDFVYLDPPYATDQRRVFREYHPDAFSPDDLERLSSELSRLDKAGAQFVVSYADCKEARALFSPWITTRVTVKRNIAGFAGHRRRAVELLATNISSS